MIYRVETRWGGSDIELFTDREQALKYFEHWKGFNTIFTELEKIGNYLYKFCEQGFYVIYRKDGRFIGRLRKELSIENIKDMIHDSYLDYGWDE